MKTLNIIGLAVLAMGTLLGVTWVIQGNNFLLYKAFAPSYEDSRRQVFENTKSYNDGMIQELQAMRFDYIKADPAHKAALASIILHRSASYPRERMPTDLARFIDTLQGDH
jgi:hypothetical protein